MNISPMLLADLAGGFSIPFLLFAAGFGVGMLLFMIARALEHRYMELFNSDTVSVPQKTVQRRRETRPIEIELEAMHPRD
jgi:hypothetical protein